jgi:hypothetical protein
MVGIASAEAGAASGLFNMMRNLGGAIGTAAVETFFTKREQFHSFIINGHVSLLEPAIRERIAELQQYFLTHGAASTVDPQLLSGKLQQYSMAQGVAGVAGAWHQTVIAVAIRSGRRPQSWAMPTASPCSASC